MSQNQSSKSAQVPNWRELYRAALRETDPAKLSARIFEAERALMLRSKELFGMDGGSDDESQAVDDALYALSALRTCLKLNTRDDKAFGRRH
jgi:hypothetical protein